MPYKSHCVFIIPHQSVGGLDGSANLSWTWRTSAELARPSAVPDGLVGARRSRTVSPLRTTELPCLLLPRLSCSPARARSHGRAAGLEGGNGNAQAGFHTSVAWACSCPIGQSKVETSLEKGVHVGQGCGGGCVSNNPFQSTLSRSALSTVQIIIPDVWLGRQSCRGNDLLKVIRAAVRP